MSTPKSPRATPNDAVLKPVVERVIDHELPAWQRFMEMVWPGIELVAGRWRNAGFLSRDVDDRRNITLLVVERLARKDFEAMRRLLAVMAPSGDSGWRWICRMAARKARDYERDHERNLGVDGEGKPCFARLVRLSSYAEEMLPASVRGADATDALAVANYAERELSPSQLAALELHLVGEPDADIAAKLGLPTPRSAFLLWYGAVMSLKYHFVVKGGR